MPTDHYADSQSKYCTHICRWTLCRQRIKIFYTQGILFVSTECFAAYGIYKADKYLFICWCTSSRKRNKIASMQNDKIIKILLSECIQIGVHVSSLPCACHAAFKTETHEGVQSKIAAYFVQTLCHTLFDSVSDFVRR